jgi:hypothetical protein
MPIQTIIEPFRIKSVEPIRSEPHGLRDQNHPVWRRRERIRGLRLAYEAAFLRHFTAHLEPVES